MLRDQLLEDLDWFSPVQRLAWSAIQFRRYFIKFLLGAQGQVGAFREVLPKQPVRVLVGAALPRRVRVAEIDRQAGTDSEIGVTRHFLALVPGHAVSQEFGKCFHFASQERSDAIGAAIVGNPHEHGDPASPLDESGDLRFAAFADDEISFPETGHRTVVSFGGAFADADHVWDLSLLSVSRDRDTRFARPCRNASLSWVRSSPFACRYRV